MVKSFPGVRTANRIRNGRKDIYFSIRYTRNGKQYEEGIGYKSDGFTAEKAYEILKELKNDIKDFKAISLRDKANQREQERIANEAANITFSELFEEYYQPHIQNKDKKSTYDREVHLYKKWLKPIFGGVKLNLISRISLIRVLQAMDKKHLSNRTKHYAVALTRQVLNFAIRNELFSGENPAARFDELKKDDNRRMRFLSEEELNDLLAEIKKHSYSVYLMALISADCGLRAGEIFKLTWADVSLETQMLFLRDTKNGRNRYAYMTNRVFYELSKLKQREGNEFVFQGRNGNKIEHVSRTFERAVRALGLNNGITDRRQKVVFHSLRHTFASRLVQRRVSLYEVKELLGHSDIAMTQRYSHLADETLREAVSKLN
ncbi:MAG: site-specific integrase [Alphaproteobacteria bacterium]|nr:site-specific integrase [Alphaproteobacteria bacterium]